VPLTTDPGVIEPNKMLVDILTQVSEFVEAARSLKSY
jgi:hypothetical protein